jgi:hypothetical protein
MRPAAGPIPGSAICPRLINPARFDKAKPPADQRLWWWTAATSRIDQFRKTSICCIAQARRLQPSTRSERRFQSCASRDNPCESGNKKKPGHNGRAFCFRKLRRRAYWYRFCSAIKFTQIALTYPR